VERATELVKTRAARRSRLTLTEVDP